MHSWLRLALEDVIAQGGPAAEPARRHLVTDSPSELVEWWLDVYQHSRVNPGQPCGFCQGPCTGTHYISPSSDGY